jgi:hypothetical protein
VGSHYTAICLEQLRQATKNLPGQPVSRPRFGPQHPVAIADCYSSAICWAFSLLMLNMNDRVTACHFANIVAHTDVTSLLPCLQMTFRISLRKHRDTVSTCRQHPFLNHEVPSVILLMYAFVLKSTALFHS